ncbi:MAG: hypothetical protein RMJ36_04960, partial [Candidatus Calescibacterium sp.]|nr:hypothetical protein [Candidatus Calescibacterium sp.]MDW8132985.1 hypothetical protein [Candidatus Calescibacterium sp.]
MSLELNRNLGTEKKNYKYGFSLYLWLALFAIFISFFSIILFNYVGSDIRAVRSIYKESRMYYDIKSILSAITEIYREKNFNRPSDQRIRQGSYRYANGVVNYNVRYEIKIVEQGTSTNPNYLFINLYKGNKLWARGIVKWRESLGDFGIITAKSTELFKSNSFYSNATVFSDMIIVQDLTNQEKIFKKVSIKDTVVVNGKTSINFENLKEIQKFAEYVEINNSLNAIMRYYNDLRDEVIRKVVDPMVNYGTQYSNAGNIILTPYGAIWIREIPNVSYVKINFNMDNNGNQIISFLDNNGNLLSTYIILMYGSLNINLDFNDEVITNDIGIINQVNNNVNNISLVPVSKVMNVNGRHYTIYTNVGDYSTIIYSD